MTTEDPSLAEVRRMLLSQDGLRRYQMYDRKDNRPIRTLREHREIVKSNLGGETDVSTES